VENEDNWVCAKIQRGLSSGGNKDFVFGKNELGLHRLHDWIDYYVEDRKERPSNLVAAGRDVANRSNGSSSPKLDAQQTAARDR